MSQGSFIVIVAASLSRASGVIDLINFVPLLTAQRCKSMDLKFATRFFMRFGRKQIMHHKNDMRLFPQPVIH